MLEGDKVDQSRKRRAWFLAEPNSMDSIVFSSSWDYRDVIAERLEKSVTEQPLRTEHGV
jgi:hypothetical protein